MTFLRRAYPHRNDRHRFPSILLEGLGRGRFTRIENPDPALLRRYGMREHGIHGERCHFEANGVVDTMLGIREWTCNQTPTDGDRWAVRTLLEAWLGQLSTDRYLDLVMLKRLHYETEQPSTVDEAYQNIRENYPGGIVRFASSTLPSSNTSDSFPIFGAAITRNSSYSQVYSAILAWDDYQCTGAIEWVSDRVDRMAAMDGGERAIEVYVRAAKRWISRAQSAPGTIYHRMSRHT